MPSREGLTVGRITGGKGPTEFTLHPRSKAQAEGRTVEVGTSGVGGISEHIPETPAYLPHLKVLCLSGVPLSPMYP